MEAQVLRPPRRDEPDSRVRLSFIRQRIESVFWTCKDVLTLERHGARTLANLRVRIATRLLTLAACIALNHQLGRPSRALDYLDSENAEAWRFEQLTERTIEFIEEIERVDRRPGLADLDGVHAVPGSDRPPNVVVVPSGRCRSARSGAPPAAGGPTRDRS
jgi:hypothetical protein